VLREFASEKSSISSALAKEIKFEGLIE